MRLLPPSRAPDWQGFVGFREFSVYWAVLASLLLTSMTVIQTQPAVRGLVYAIAGAVVGTHEKWLRRRVLGAKTS